MAEEPPDAAAIQAMIDAAVAAAVAAMGTAAPSQPQAPAPVQAAFALHPKGQREHSMGLHHESRDEDSHPEHRSNHAGVQW